MRYAPPSINGDGAADDGAVTAETPEPEAVAEDRHAVASRPVFVRKERSAKRRPDAQQLEQARRNGSGVETLR
jgi:hypothetical protein